MKRKWQANDLNFDRSSTWANPVKTEGSKQRYSFDRHETVFSNGLYHVTYMSELSPTYRLKQIEPVIRTMCFYKKTYVTVTNKCHFGSGGAYISYASLMVKVVCYSPC